MECRNKFYWAYTPAYVNGKWCWQYCKSKKNYSKLPDYAFVEFQTDKSLPFNLLKGTYEGFGQFEISRPLIKVGTYKKIKDNPDAYDWIAYTTPKEIFRNGVEPEYAHITNEAKVNVCFDNDEFNCIAKETITELNNICGVFGKKPDSKPGAELKFPECKNAFALFKSDKLKQWVPVETPTQSNPKIYPIHSQDPMIEDNTTKTYRDYFLDGQKDLKIEAPRYVYAEAIINKEDWDVVFSPNTYFTASLISQGSFDGEFDTKINLRDCKDYLALIQNNNGNPNSLTPKCKYVRNAYTDPGGTTHYTLRFPIKTFGAHSLVLNKFDGINTLEYGKYDFNILLRNRVNYKIDQLPRGLENVQRELPLTLIDFQGINNIPAIKDCKLDPFNGLEESIEDAFSLDENTMESQKRDSFIPGVDFKIKTCSENLKEFNPLSNYFDQEANLKMNVQVLKSYINNINEEEYRIAYFLYINSIASEIAKNYTGVCDVKDKKNQDEEAAVAFLGKEVVYTNSQGEKLDLDSNQMVVQGKNHRLNISFEDHTYLKTAGARFGAFAHTLPNNTYYGFLFGRVIFIFEKYLLELDKLLSASNVKSVATIILIHELGHVYANHYMFDREKTTAEDQHQSFCTGKDNCDCIFRYDNQTNEWYTKSNLIGARFCESHRQLFLNQLIRKP